MADVSKIKQVRRWPLGDDAYSELRWREELERRLATDTRCKVLRAGIELMLEAMRHAEQDVTAEQLDRYAVPSAFQEGRPPIYWRTYALWSRELEDRRLARGFREVAKLVHDLGLVLTGVDHVT